MLLTRVGENAKQNSASFKIPNDRSILSMIDNRFEDGDDFRRDGWVYDRDGNQKKKWFSSLWDNDQIGVIWEPKYNDIPLLESKRWKAIQRYQKWCRDVYDPAFQAVKEVGQAHAYITHAFNGSCPPWWLYSYKDYNDGHGGGISMDWVDEPKEPLSLDVGNRWYHVEFYLWRQMIRRKRMFEVAFNRAMEKHLLGDYKDMPKFPGETMKFAINGRTYWYITAVNHHGCIIWQPLALPEKPVVEVTL